MLSGQGGARSEGCPSLPDSVSQIGCLAGANILKPAFEKEAHAPGGSRGPVKKTTLPLLVKRNAGNSMRT